jgi:uncharacterized protein (DUF433 family)
VTEELNAIAARLENVAKRMDQVAMRLAASDSAKQATATESRWQYLIARPHRWRRQLCMKGRNITVGQLVSTLRANGMTPEQASESLDLPLAAICEALTYAAENRGLIDLEASEERRRIA